MEERIARVPFVFRGKTETQSEKMEEHIDYVPFVFSGNMDVIILFIVDHVLSLFIDKQLL